MDLYFKFVFFLLGLTIGSFLNVVIYRIPEGESIAQPPSHCPSCGTRLKPLDLVPIFSWLFLKGRCRHCSTNISPRYALVELLTGIVFLFTYIKFGLDWYIIVAFGFMAVLIAMTFIDMDHQIIPDELNIFLIVFFVATNLFISYIPWKDAIFGALIGFAPLFLIVLLTGGSGMGMGDVKLMFALGLYLGFWNSILTVFLSFIYGGVFGVLLLVTKIKGRKDAIPFGPWIALGAVTAFYFGAGIIGWYMGMLV
ncbi:prepilin peptidase [Alkalibacter mobilis]|uniref:prepilin peptidase n=1 Tax=Alkalibacter mobilis TaxID=2787712 RepID=UPI00189D7A97|nr:A24 family peptidase [Alkalibacter mobilis]MBF7095758.1 prepilin peptidase [Alkalibacter mobilis]